MFHLNVDCLSEIFNNMPLGEKINMARICNNFRNVVELGLSRQFTTLKVSHDLKYELKSDDIKMLLEMISSNLTELDIVILFLEVNYVPNLDYYFTLNLDSLVKLNLEGSMIEDHHILLFGNKCKNLRSFSVGYSNITGKFINKMKQITELGFHLCSIQQKQMKQILSELALEKLKVKYNWPSNLSEALMSNPIPSLRHLYINEGEYFGILFLETFPLTSLIHKHPDSDDDSYVYNMKPPIELKRVRSNLQKLTFFGSIDWSCIQYLVSYLHNTLPELDYIEIFSMNFLNSILHLIDCCSQFQCIETMFNIFRFSNTDVDRFIEELQRRNRSFRLVFCYSEPEYSYGLECFQKTLQGSPIYKLQNELTIEFKNDPECYRDHFVRYDMCDTNL